MNRDRERASDADATPALVARLTAASLGIVVGGDPETVLHRAAAEALDLTGARRAVAAMLGADGRPREFGAAGLAEAERSRAAQWSEGSSLLEHLILLAGPAGPIDARACAGALGVGASDVLPDALLGASIRLGGIDAGYLVLEGKKDGGAFVSGDGEVLALLAAQAAAGLAAARANADGRTEALLDALIDTAPVGVVVFDAPAGAVRSVNREAKRIVEELRMPGHTAEQLVEVVTLERADGRRLDLVETPLASELMQCETVRGEELVMSVPDGRKVATLIDATPVRSVDGTVAWVVVTLQDLAPIRELERLRSEFLGTVSHELRAPLMSIKGSADTLLGAHTDLDPAEMREFHRTIAEQADHMRGLISDLLDAGRLDTGTLSVFPEPTDVAALVERARNTFVTGGGRQPVLIDLPLDLPQVMTDRRRIVQVLNNLFSNAARHAPTSSPIRVAAWRDGVHVAVSVTDEGRGVAPEDLPHLFQKHTRPGDAERGLVGTGLGLAICKGLVEAHGGRIRAESGGAGQGTRFTFTVPVALGDIASEDWAKAAARGAIPPAEQHPPRILVVDDDPNALRFARDALDAAGYIPLVTGDHRELPRILRNERPKLVVLDLVLPETDGIELMESVPELGDLPVIFISAYGRDETIARALEAGAADYVVKPFSGTELTARIRAALRRNRDPEPFLLEKLAIRYDERLVTVAGRPVALTPAEYELLRELSRNTGRVVAYETLVRRVSGKPYGRNARLALSTLVKNLRRKLGDSADDPAYILTERGVGYRMPRPAAASGPVPGGSTGGRPSR